MFIGIFVAISMLVDIEGRVQYFESISNYYNYLPTMAHDTVGILV